MLTKDNLIKKFRKNPEHYWKVKLFDERGFVRKQCPTCSKFFWTLDRERKLCGDSSCEGYAFIGKPVTKKKWDYVQAWKEFEKFFKKEGHASIPRYPVVDRWRPDLYFTIASIQDFQRIDKGQIVMEYPADPLIVPQVCLRFSDIANVGVTGRHHTSFVMPGQHSFGKYWKDRCIELNFEFLNKVMGIPEGKIMYIEDLWTMPDYSQFGPSLETVAMGLELVNSVFSQFTKDGNGFKELPVKVIDVGWGLERLAWFSQGTATGYDAVFGPVVKWMKKQAGVKETEIFGKYSVIAGRLDFDEVQDIKKVKEQLANELGITVGGLNEMVEPLQALYSIADHTKTLLFAITDGGIISNVGGGYNLRVILRRALSFIKEFDFDFDLMKIAELHAKHLKKMFPELREGVGLMERIIGVEKEQYEKSFSKAAGLVVRELEKGIEEKELIVLYTSHGVTPELVEKIAVQEGKEFHIPEDFYQKVMEHHLGGKKEKETYEGELEVDVSSLPPTQLLFYQDPYQKEMEARVVGSFDVRGEVWVALDRTVFYPEGGGQPADRGVFIVNGKEMGVSDVQKIGGVVLHKTERRVQKGATVTGKIDWERRDILIKMHDATHIVAGACRKVLGRGAWQAGAQKGLQVSRLDVTHFRPFSQEELERIESLANEIVKKNVKITATFLPRGEAEGKYGFVLYQGGASPGKEVRVVEISGHDVEACGGTHAYATGTVGRIKIVKAERIQDGVNRLVFTCGEAAVKYEEGVKNLYKDVVEVFRKGGVAALPSLKDVSDVSGALLKAADVFSVGVKQLPKTAERFLKEIEKKDTVEGSTLSDISGAIFIQWKEERKEKEQRGREEAARKAEALLKKIKNHQIFEIIAGERKELIQIASDIIAQQPEVTVILANQGGEIIGMSKTKDMGLLIKELCQKAGGSGGGREGLGQGKVQISKIVKLMGA